MRTSLSQLALHELGDRDARPAAHDVGDVLGVDLLLQERMVALELGERGRSPSSISRSSVGSSP